VASPIREARIESWQPAVTVRFTPLVALTDDQLFDFCQLNRDLRIEQTAEGVLVFMAPAGAEASARNAELTRQLGNWARADGTGLAFDSSVGFTLPNGATRSPDASWIRAERWAALPPSARRRFPLVCPDFVVELRSASDPLAALQAKMVEYIDNGARLGWLLDPERRAAHVYRPGRPPQVLLDSEALPADPSLPGFVLDLRLIW